ncbi:adaptor protein MecA [Lacticaseibacillus nasuensis]|uniref:Adapter protein MecA n=1 Tax=Lacticaseibacillus nasuensis JCM 17158 TaxID=1291734 RepID=A0A0R1JKD9_9LACO|nr:adaptor protein MecA [Lacticaseibacillus nasuensis]KRK71821.1 adaptor protein [Lacticaseibacillus nasuensis JCM 17158]MCX2455444.1 adaptor protein MecA [Lacticaseibacillus nasuensis]
MEMERLNADTIRVTLGNDDLAERGITVLDLLGNHKQIEQFFYSILDEVDTDHSFADNSAVTFQVMPSQSGLELLISKNMRNDGDSTDEPAITAASDASEPDSVPDFIRRQLTALDTDHNEPIDEGGYIDDHGVPVNKVVVKFADFEDFVQLAHSLHLEGAASDLYRYQDTYYLVLTFYPNQLSVEEAKDQLAVALEYGDQVALSADVLAEYGQSLMATSAIETARYYFK